MSNFETELSKEEITKILNSFNKLLDYIKVSDDERKRKDLLKNKILQNFNIDDIDYYLEETSFLLEKSTNENQKIQEAFINGIKDNISTLFSTLTQNEDFRNESTETDSKITSLMDNELLDMQKYINNNDMESIASSVSSITQAITAFKEEKEEQAKRAKDYVKQMSQYAAKTEERLKKMNQILQDREEELVMDKLTQVFNRRGFENKKPFYFSEFMKGNNMSVVVADIDDFKQINDTHGHRAGDGALATIAKILKEKTKGKGDVFRYGGEEFILVFPYLDTKEALALTLNIQQYLSKNNFQNAKKETVKLTLSFGFHCMRKGETLDEAFEIADQRLYKAKNNGKNQVVFK